MPMVEKMGSIHLRDLFTEGIAKIRQRWLLGSKMFKMIPAVLKRTSAMPRGQPQQA